MLGRGSQSGEGGFWGGDGGSTHRRSLTAHLACSSRARSSSQASGPRLLSCRLVQGKIQRVEQPKCCPGGAAHPVLPIATPLGLPSRSPPRFPPQKGAQGTGAASASESVPAGAREGRGPRALPGGAEGLGGEQDPSKPSPSSRGRKRRPAPLHGRLHLCERCSPPPGRREDCSAPNGPRRTPCPLLWGPHPLLGPNGASYRGAPSNGMEPAGTGRCSRGGCGGTAGPGTQHPSQKQGTTDAVVLGDGSEHR